MIPTQSWVAFLTAHWSVLGTKLVEHINLAISSTLLATLIGMPLGIWIHRQAKARGIVLSATNILQTIPSLALLALLIPILGIGIKPAMVALAIYALLPITRNTFVGLQGVAPEMIEVADGLGFTPWQRMRLIEIPLALPVIVAGIRTATAVTIGITTIAAFIGAGGLGDFIIQGLSLDNTKLILLGAIPVALLALTVDFMIAQLEDGLNQHKRTSLGKRIRLISAGFIALLLLLSLLSMTIVTIQPKDKNTIVIGSKNFTEQFILGNLMADMITAKTNLHVVRKFNLGSVTVLQNAMLKGAIDLYPEYTGTAYQVVLKHRKILKPAETYKIVKAQYQQRFNLTWLKPFGFSNSQGLAVKQSFAMQNEMQTFSQLAKISPQLTIAAPAAFTKRPDGLPALIKGYDFKFKKTLQMEPDLMYDAILDNAVQVIAVFTTDARIQAYKLTVLIDNKHIYPPYDAAPVIRTATLKAHPEIKTALIPLASLINTKTMQHLNYEVNVMGHSPATVAKDFLVSKKLIPANATK